MQYMVVSKRHVINAAVASPNNPHYNLKASCGAAGSGSSTGRSCKCVSIFDYSPMVMLAVGLSIWNT